MTTEDFKQLEGLLGKLGSYMGGKRFAIIPRFEHDGCHIALYDDKGNNVRDLSGPDIETVSGLIRVQVTGVPKQLT